MTRRMMTQRTFVCLIVGLFGTMSAARAQPVTVVSPAGLEDVDGNEVFFPHATYPDPIPAEGLPPEGVPLRAQEVHPSSAFESLGPGPFVITSLAWRPDIRVNEAITADWDFTFILSTTQNSPLDMTFSENYGPGGYTEVFSDLVQFATDGVPRGDNLPHDFDYLIEFTTPFVYEPQQGDLLVEWNTPTWLGDAPFWADADVRTGEFIIGFVGETDAFAPGLGLFTTQFTIVPEPSSLLLIFFALVLGGWRKWKHA